ncbi:SRPBCC domain-containing protein [Kribbella sp. NPDC056861]|uniref:SRPBCC domain-containing protein n=1 Tax=Kribbella sp. NPDC056861 TaxID=3154857 RepID=UPI003425415D
MRKLIAAMKMSLDAKIEGPDGTADWAESWSEDFGLTAQVDACLLGGGMYPGYEGYWTSVQTKPQTPAWITGEPPTAAELEWADFVKETPHYVLSTTLETANWPNVTFLRSVAEVAELKAEEGGDIYLVGGARITASLIEAGLVDELRLITYPLIAGADSKALFPTAPRRKAELTEVRQLEGGKIASTYVFGGDAETPHELVLTNVYSVVPEAVWAAWTDPDQFAQWWVGSGFTTSGVVMELRPGGRFAARQTSDDGSIDLPFNGFVRAAVPGERLVFTLSENDSPDQPARTELTVNLRAVDGGTEQEFHQTGVVTDEHFEALKAGTITFFDQLGEHLASRRPS